MQIKTTMRYYYTPIRMIEIQNTDNTKWCWGCGVIGALIHCWWECKMVQSLWKTVWQFLKKLNVLLPTIQQSLSLLLIQIHWNCVHTKTYAWIFIATLFKIVKSWRQPQCPPVGKQINKLWYNQTVQYYSALKRNEMSNHKKTWKNLKCMLLNEGSQSAKAMYCMIPTIYDILGKAKLWKQ